MRYYLTCFFELISAYAYLYTLLKKTKKNNPGLIFNSNCICTSVYTHIYACMHVRYANDLDSSRYLYLVLCLKESYYLVHIFVIMSKFEFFILYAL